MDEFLGRLILAPSLCGRKLSTEVCVKPSCCPCPTILTLFYILKVHLGGISSIVQKRMAFMLTHFPSTTPKSSKYQGAIPGTPSTASYMMGGSLALGIRTPAFLQLVPMFLRRWGSPESQQEWDRTSRWKVGAGRRPSSGGSQKLCGDTDDNSLLSWGPPGLSHAAHPPPLRLGRGRPLPSSSLKDHRARTDGAAWRTVNFPVNFPNFPNITDCFTAPWSAGSPPLETPLLSSQWPSSTAVSQSLWCDGCKKPTVSQALCACTAGPEVSCTYSFLPQLQVFIFLPREMQLIIYLYWA